MTLLHGEVALPGSMRLVTFLCVFGFFFFVAVQFFIVNKIYADFCHNSNALSRLPVSSRSTVGIVCEGVNKYLHSLMPVKLDDFFPLYSKDLTCSLSVSVYSSSHSCHLSTHFVSLALFIGLLQVVVAHVVVVAFKISLS